MPYNAYKLVRV